MLPSVQSCYCGDESIKTNNFKLLNLNFIIFAPYENYSCHNRQCVVDSGTPRDISPCVAHYAIFVALGSGVGQGLTTSLHMANKP